MDIEDIKQAKMKCESEIRAIIMTFELQTGMKVRGCDLLKETPFGAGPSVVGVRLEVELW